MYARPKPGEWVPHKQDGYLSECCDCSLVHRIDFIVVSKFGLWISVLINLLGARAMMRLYRDEDATAQQRASRKSACQAIIRERNVRFINGELAPSSKVERQKP